MTRDGFSDRGAAVHGGLRRKKVLAGVDFCKHTFDIVDGWGTAITTAVTAAVTAAVDELSAVDPADLSDDDLDALVVSVQRCSHRLAGLRARLIGQWDRRRVWESDGSRSPGHRLARTTSMSVAAGKREVRRARALSSMPHTAAAVAKGLLSPQHVDLLAGANDGARTARFR